MANAQDVTLNDITINASPEMGFSFGLGRGVHTNNCRVDRSNGRPLSTTADAVHFDSNGGDVIIENSTFAYQGDDGLNMHTQLLAVAPLPSCKSATGNCPSPLPASFGAQNGDRIALFSPWMKFMSMQTAACSTAACTANVAPIAAPGGFAADLALAGGRYVVQNNVFSHNRGRGFLVQTPYGLVQNNSFVGQSWFALYLSASTFWHEGAGAHDVLFLNNTISSSGIGGGLGAVTLATEDSDGVIYDSTPASASGQPNSPGTQQNIVFANNSFSNLPGAAFYISSANNVILYDNAFTNLNLHASSRVPSINAPVAIYDASNILLSGNTSNSNYSLFLSNITDGSITVK